MNTRYVFLIFIALFISKISLAQDEIILKKTRKPLDYELKIVEVKNDSIYFKAFRKIKGLPLSDVYEFTANGKTIYPGTSEIPAELQKTESPSKSSRDDLIRKKDLPKPDPQAVITIGIFQGGGSLVGGDIEIKLSEKMGVQAGAGLYGYGAAINFHPESGLRNSCISLSYWHQGIGETYTQSMIGPTYVFRGKRGFTAQLGIGKTIEITNYMKSKFPNYNPPVVLLYSIGWCFPL